MINRPNNPDQQNTLIWPILLAVFAVNILETDYSVSQYIFLIVLALVAAGLPVEI